MKKPEWFQRICRWVNPPPRQLPPIDEADRNRIGRRFKYPHQVYCRCRKCFNEPRKSGYCRPHEIDRQRWKGLA